MDEWLNPDWIFVCHGCKTHFRSTVVRRDLAVADAEKMGWREYDRGIMYCERCAAHREANDHDTPSHVA